jgi:hypothetical protein
VSPCAILRTNAMNIASEQSPVAFVRNSTAKQYNKIAHKDTCRSPHLSNDLRYF